jgi:hypothetical protein
VQYTISDSTFTFISTIPVYSSNVCPFVNGCAIGNYKELLDKRQKILRSKRYYAALGLCADNKVVFFYVDSQSNVMSVTNHNPDIILTMQ